MKTEFFVAIVPPEITHQQKKVTVRNGKPYFYEPQKLKAARAKLEAHLAQYIPEVPYDVGVQLVTKWCFPAGDKHRDGEYRITPPDTDNLQKLLKDVMTRVGFWRDDCLVASEVVEKFWAAIPGIYIAIRPLEVET